VEALTGQGFAGSSQGDGRSSETVRRSPSASESGGRENTGQLSNPGPRAIQRRLRAAEIDDLVTGYRAGRSLRDLAGELGVHPRTVAAHLEQRGVQRRLNLPKMSEHAISDASRRYRAGNSLATVGKTHGVDAATVRRQLLRAGVRIRPRPGF
jgi:hypothetical protein